MPQGPGTWRELLKSLSKQEKQTIVQQLGIQSKTLQRWIRGQTELPHVEKIRQLLTVLPPQKRTLFAQLLQQDSGFAKYADSMSFSRSKVEIPSTFYARIMETNASTSGPIRFTAICQLVLIQGLRLLDPDSHGLCMKIFTCTIPFQEGKVRSLLQQCSLGTHPWVTIVNQSSFFVGTESITGKAVMGGKPVVIQQVQAENGASPSPHWDAYAVSAAAHSIRRGERVAGVLFVASTKEHFFTPDRLKVLRDYCHLLVLAFDEEELYPQEQLALGVMPSILVQHNYLAQVLKGRNGSNSSLLGERLALRSKVERGLIHQIETDLLAMATHY